jgi:hypothetical protein
MRTIKNGVQKMPSHFHLWLAKTCLAVILGLSVHGSAIAEPLSSWDKQFDSAGQRFVLLPELEGVLDKETQLVWEQHPSKFIVTWEIANLTCLETSHGDRFGWRLPTLTEFLSLFVANGLLPQNHPFDPPQGVWTSTQTGLSPKNAWFFHIFDGRPYEISKNSFGSAWCVRGKHPGYH